MEWSEQVVLVTGGTGSFGQAFVHTMLETYHPKALRILSRDELKQYEMQRRGWTGPHVSYFIGDIRDRERLYRATVGVDILIHAAALKQVPSCEYNPFEAVKTNILGAQNIIEAAIDNGVQRVVALSTDKAVNPVNLYGATKLCAEKIFIQGNAYASLRDAKFACVRYGNVVGSRGSVILLFQRQRKHGVLTITDKRMSRFWITLQTAVDFVIHCAERSQGGEVFVPKIPSMKIIDLARVIAPECDLEIVGIRPGEKLTEVLITSDESRYALEFNDYYVIKPQYAEWGELDLPGGTRLPDGFQYDSETNPDQLTPHELRDLIRDVEFHD